MANNNMKHLHALIPQTLYDDLEKLLPFHGGVSHGTRIAIKLLLSQIADGSITIKDIVTEIGDQKGDDAA